MPIKVLTIDDDPAMTDLLSLLLKTNKLEAITANNGQDGIELVKNAHPDLVLLDMMMPEMDGWEVCKEIRKFSTVPIIVLSALNNPGLVANALDAGADDYLVKPVPSSVLLAHIRNLTRRKNTSNLRPPDTKSLQKSPVLS
jgi:two-component system KDP operon response regulator KdpE